MNQQDLNQHELQELEYLRERQRQIEAKRKQTNERIRQLVERRSALDASAGPSNNFSLSSSPSMAASHDAAPRHSTPRTAGLVVDTSGHYTLVGARGAPFRVLSAD